MTIAKVGFYGGKFLPIHMGHVYAMTSASTMVEELHIIVSHDEEYERSLFPKDSPISHIPHTIRVRWWSEITKDMPNVHVHAVYEEQTNKFSDWEAGAVGIREAIGKDIDVVFSSEHEYSDIFGELYPDAQHVVIDSNRLNYDISATQLRKEGVMKHWNMIPDVVKPYFTKKVVVVGTESTGKSTLVRNLARMYNTTYVEEWGRTFYERLGLGNCDDITLKKDFVEIAYEHKYNEKIQLAKSNKVLLVDTEAIVTQYYSLLYLDKRHDVIDEMIKVQNYDLWLFLEPNVPWINDGTRSFGDAETRSKNNNLLKFLLKQHGIKYEIINENNYRSRLLKSVSLIDSLLR